MSLMHCSGALALMHRVDEADELIEQALALDPWSPLVWMRRSWLSAYLGDSEAALRGFRTTLHLMPFEPLRHTAYIGMGCAHFAAGRYDRAARWAQSGVEAYPGSFWGERIAIAAAVHAGALAEARRMARRLLRKDPDLTVSVARLVVNGSQPISTAAPARMLKRSAIPPRADRRHTSLETQPGPQR